jgi:hypothetical protein
VTGQIDLRDDGDAPLGGVRDDLAQLVLGVEPAVPGAVVGELRLTVRHLADHGLRPPRADLGESGVGVDLDPPALVVGEVEVQHVQPVQGERVDQPEYELLRHEVPGDVEHHPAPSELRRVGDPHGRYCESAVDLLGRIKQLPVRRLGVPQRFVGASGEPGALRRHVDPVLRLGEVLHHGPDRLGDRVGADPLPRFGDELAGGWDDRDRCGHPDSKSGSSVRRLHKDPTGLAAVATIR